MNTHSSPRRMMAALSVSLVFMIAPATLAADLSTVIDRHLGTDERLDPDEATAELRQGLASTGSVFHPDAQLGPLARALLTLEAVEPPQPHSRLRIRLHDQHDGPGGPVWLVEAARFNLGPARRADLAASLGEDVIAPPEDFGTGPHLDYRFVMRPMQGTAAMLEGIARSEISLDNETCLGAPCGSLVPVAETLPNWSEPEQRNSLSFHPPYLTELDGHLSPAAALDLTLEELGLLHNEEEQLSWSGIEPRSRHGDDPYLEVVLETGLGQDGGLEATAVQYGVMDHTIKTLLVRVQSPASVAELQIYLSRSNVPR